MIPAFAGTILSPGGNQNEFNMKFTTISTYMPELIKSFGPIISKPNNNKVDKY